MSNHIRALTDGLWTIPLLNRAEVGRLLRLTTDPEFESPLTLVSGHNDYLMVFSRILPFFDRFGSQYLWRTPHVEQVFPHCQIQTIDPSTVNSDWQQQSNSQQRLRMVVQLTDTPVGGQLQVQCRQGLIYAPLNQVPAGTAAIIDGRLQHRIRPVGSEPGHIVTAWLMQPPVTAV